MNYEEAKSKKLIVKPWDDSEFWGSKADKIAVYSALHDLKYPKKYQDSPPNGKFLRIINEAMRSYLWHDKWLMLISNNYQFLQQVSAILPQVYALSTLRSCMNVSTDQIVKAVSAKQYSDPFRSDPNEIFLHNVETTALLLWEDITMESEASKRASARLADLLKVRAKKRAPHVFTAYYKGTWNENSTPQSIFRLIAQNLGDYAEAMISERVSILFVPVEQKTINVQTVDLGED